MNHLVDEERLDFRLRLKLMLQHPEEPWPAITPTAWVTEHRYNTRDLQASLADYLRERGRSVRWLRSLGKVDWNVRYVHQSRSIRAGDLFAAWVAHDGLHIRQLNELHRALLVRVAKPYRVGYAGEW